MKPRVGPVRSHLVVSRETRPQSSEATDSVLPPDTSGTRFPGAASMAKQTFLWGPHPYLPSTDLMWGSGFFFPQELTYLGEKHLSQTLGAGLVGLRIYEEAGGV